MKYKIILCLTLIPMWMSAQNALKILENSGASTNHLLSNIESHTFSGGMLVTEYKDATPNLESNLTVIDELTFVTTQVWTGTTSSDWITTTNWSNGTLPTTSSDVIIPTALANYPVFDSAAATLNSINIKPGATLTINSDKVLTVTENLTLESISSKYASLLLDGTITGTVNYKRHVNTVAGSGTTTGANDLISAPLSGQAFDDFAAANANLARYDGNDLTFFGPYNNNTPAYEKWDEFTNETALSAGIGYRAGSTDTSTFTFTGTVQTGDVNVDITSGTDNDWNLIGNPYPSYIKVQDFLNEDVGNGDTNIDLLADATKAIYGYDGAASDGWVIYNLANTTASTLMAPGQGFFVKVDDTKVGTDIKFTASQRSAGSSDDFISGKGKTTKKAVSYHLELQLESGAKNYRTYFYFNDNSSLGLDPGYDAALYKSDAPKFAVYSHLVEENTGLNMGIQSLSIEDLESVTIPLGIHAKAGEKFTVSIATSSLEAGTYVYIKDHATDELTLLNDTDFTVTPSEDLSSTGNFSLVVSSSEVLAVNELNGQDTLEVYTTASEKSLHINGVLNDVTTVAIYDIQGRNVITQILDQNSSSNTIDLSTLKSGIYIVQVSSNSIKQTKKVPVN